MSNHDVECDCRECRFKHVQEVELVGDDPVHDFLRILTKVAKKSKKDRSNEVGNDLDGC